MKKEDFFEILGELDDDIVKEAKTPMMKKKMDWKVWGTMAACLCLIVGVAAITQILNHPHTPIEGSAQLEDDDVTQSPSLFAHPEIEGGVLTEGNDSMMSLLAVYPAAEDAENVKNATCIKIDEEAAYAVEGLGEHLPEWLPDGMSFQYAALSETTMKDGTKYYMLRVFYGTGEVIFSSDCDFFNIFVMNFEPEPKEDIHQVEDLPEFLNGSWKNGGTFFFKCGDVCIGFDPNGHRSVDEILSIITSIP